MTGPMSDERLADLDQRITNGCNTYDCDCDNAPCGLEPHEARELLAEVKRARDAEGRLRDDVADRDYVNAQLRSSITSLRNSLQEECKSGRSYQYEAKKLRAQLAKAGEAELEWGVRAIVRATGRAEDSPQPSEESARVRVARSGGGSVLICRTRAGQWRKAEQGEA